MNNIGIRSIWPLVFQGLLWGAAMGLLSAAPGKTSLAGLHVALDVGHSKVQGGAVSASGRNEFEYNLETARTVAGVLRSFGAKVTVINDNGDVTGLAERPWAAVRLGADAFISIHHDSVNDKYLKNWEVDGVTQQYCDRFSGYSVFCSKKNPKAGQSRNLALEIGAAMLNARFKPTLHHHEPIPGENRPFIDEHTGVYEYTNLAVVKYGNLPSALLECGVILNREEERQVRTKEYQQRIGEALATALAAAREKGLVGPAPAKGLGKLFKVQ
jgi:N-acetylmuramoyl-L-alanine amidase